SAWVNFEMVNSFSTERGWGEFNLEEAWVKYRKNRGFSLKAGYLIPVFNNLNEVKNRMPYLPYIMRPLVYEASMSGVVDISDFLPERAFLQAYGAAPAGKANVEYAVFIGPGERSLFASKNDPAGTGTPGADTTTFVEVGGRLGVKVAGLKAGVSGTLDKDNQQQMLGKHVQRVRFGSDFSGTINKIFFEAEVILVKEDPKADVDLDKTFWYGTLGYQLANEVFVYGMYSYVKDANSPYFGEGINAVFGGVNCQLTNGLLLKAQGLKFMSNDTHFSVPVEGLGLVPAYTNISGYFLSTALSVSF
ncbi:MAG: hypothetical protein KDE57_13665, partial [Calditrichaeota bacterium]|nr:hypothetical protein [Calditrichota bacterium]